MKSVTVLYHYTRCGSTVLADAIGQHPEVQSMGEILNPKTQRYKRLFSSGGSSMSLAMLVDLLEEEWIKSNKPHLVFEITSYDIKMGRLAVKIVDLLGQISSLYALHLIHLVRHNVFERKLSSMLAAESNLWQVGHDEQQAQGKIRVDLPLKAIRAAIWSGSTAIMRDKCLFEPFSPLSLEYECHVREDVNVASSLVFNHIGIHPVHVESRFRKLPNPEDRIENWSDIREAVIAAGLGDFLRRS